MLNQFVKKKNAKLPSNWQDFDDSKILFCFVCFFAGLFESSPWIGVIIWHLNEHQSASKYAMNASLNKYPSKNGILSGIALAANSK